MLTLKIFGQASQKIIKEIRINTKIIDNLSLMEFLVQNNLTIASSCGGVGACSRCIINNNILSCQITIKEFIDSTPILRIDIAYL